MDMAKDEHAVGSGHAAADMTFGEGPDTAGGKDAMHLGEALLQRQHLGLGLDVRRDRLIHGRYFTGATLRPSFSMSGLNCSSCARKKRVNSARFM